ncbi:PHP domain-containing protein [Enterococcus sp. LJL98]
MKYYDQHLHTFLSFDSDEKFENYLGSPLDFFVATDHFDLNNAGTGFKDDIPDYHLLTTKLNQLQEQYATTFLKGIELGVVPGQETQIMDYLAKHPYDLKLLSIHQNGHFDYMDDRVLTMDKFEVAKMYFEQMEDVLTHFPEGQILTHFEYGLRRFDFSEKELEEHFEKALIRIFRLAIQRELAVEINAKSFGRYKNAHLYHYAIPLYQSLGGKLFTLGSDAHVAEDYALLFPEMTQMLQKFDVKELAVFQGKEVLLTDLPK